MISLVASGEVLCIGISKAGDDTGEEERDGVEATVGAEVDQDHDVEFGIFECFNHKPHLESFFLVCRVPGETSMGDLAFPGPEEFSAVRVLQSDRIW
jgi:hypothetical protein